MAGPGRHGPRADGDLAASASPGTRRRGCGARATAGRRKPEFHVVAIDYGVKRNILRLLAEHGCKVTVVPAKTSAEDILALKPDGVFLSNGPGDPAATGEYAVPVIQKLVDTGTPTFGICLGHQMLGIALGGKTMKMHQGHHGANHPVKDLTTGKVEITSMNHGFAVDKDTLPANVDADPCLAVRRLELRHRAQGQAGVLGAVSPGSLARPARQPLPVHALRRADAQAEDPRGLSVVRYKLVIFDFDGTLADSFPWFAGVLNGVADRYGFRRVAACTRSRRCAD